MKKLLLSAAAVFVFGIASAQDAGSYSKGDVFITGAVGITSQSKGDVKFTGVEFSPKAGYFVTDKIAVGLGLGINSLKEDNGNDILNIVEKNTTISGGLFGRYYFTPSSQFSVFGQLGFNYESTKSVKEETNFLGIKTTQEVKETGFNAGFAPGINYFISNKFAVEATWGLLEYRTSKPDVDGAEATNTFKLGLNLTSINLGLTYKF